MLLDASGVLATLRKYFHYTTLGTSKNIEQTYFRVHMTRLFSEKRSNFHTEIGDLILKKWLYDQGTCPATFLRLNLGRDWCLYVWNVVLRFYPSWEYDYYETNESWKSGHSYSISPQIINNVLTIVHNHVEHADVRTSITHKTATEYFQTLSVICALAYIVILI